MPQDGVALPRNVVRDPAELPAREAAVASIEAAVNGSKGAEAEQKRRAAREEFVERAAYTWINRLLALRTLEARGLIDETLRANPDYDGLSEALYALRQEQPQRAGGADGGWRAVITDACAAQSTALPGRFDPRDPSAALQPSMPALLRCIALVGQYLYRRLNRFHRRTSWSTTHPAGECRRAEALGWARLRELPEAAAAAFAGDSRAV